MEAMELLVRQGKALCPGYSNYDMPGLVDAQKAARACRLRFTSDQIRYTLFGRACERSLIPHCIAEGLGILVWSPLEQGLLTESHLSGQPPAGSRFEAQNLAETLLTPANLKAISALADIAHARGPTPGAARPGMAPAAARGQLVHCRRIQAAGTRESLQRGRNGPLGDGTTANRNDTTVERKGHWDKGGGRV